MSRLLMQFTRQGRLTFRRLQEQLPRTCLKWRLQMWRMHRQMYLQSLLTKCGIVFLGLVLHVDPLY